MNVPDRTRLYSAFHWQRMIWENVRELAGMAPVQTIFGCAEGMEAVLVGAGPSLNIPKVRELSRDLSVFCLARYAKSLQDAGVQLGAVINGDAWVGGKTKGKTPLVTVLRANAMTTATWGGPIYLGSITPNEERVTGCAMLRDGATTAVMMLNVAQRMGFSRVYTSGLDFAGDRSMPGEGTTDDIKAQWRTDFEAAERDGKTEVLRRLPERYRTGKPTLRWEQIDGSVIGRIREDWLHLMWPTLSPIQAWGKQMMESATAALEANQIEDGMAIGYNNAEKALGRELHAVHQ